MIVRLLFALLLWMGMPAAIRSQSATPAIVFPESNGRALKGVRSFDARTVVAVWLNMTRNRDSAERNMQAAFELSLRRDGAHVSLDAPNYLYCEVSFAYVEGIVFYHWQVQYYEFRPNDVQALLWTTSGVVSVGERNFEDAAPARQCADAFANEWLKWNPRP